MQVELLEENGENFKTDKIKRAVTLAAEVPTGDTERTKLLRKIKEALLKVKI